jgi:hypothetical protein
LRRYRNFRIDRKQSLNDAVMMVPSPTYCPNEILIVVLNGVMFTILLPFLPLVRKPCNDLSLMSDRLLALGDAPFG